MFITYTPQAVQFQYGIKGWQYTFNEIAEIGIVRKRKRYSIRNFIFITVAALLYYYLFFTDLKCFYLAIALIACFAAIVFFWFHNPDEFTYYLLVRDKKKKETKIKIKARDRHIIRKQLEYYEKLNFDRASQIHE